MTNPEKPIPISKGKEIKLEDLQKKFKAEGKRLFNLMERMLAEIKWREDLYSQELKKPTEKLNYDLLIALTEELENLNKNFDKTDDLHDEILDRQEKLRDTLNDMRELSELTEKIEELENNIKETTEKKEE